MLYRLEKCKKLKKLSNKNLKKKNSQQLLKNLKRKSWKKFMKTHWQECRILEIGIKDNMVN